MPREAVADKEQYILQSVDHALQILELLAAQGPLTAAEAARALGMGKTTAFRLLTTLENRKFVNKGPGSRYCLGIKFSALGSVVLDQLQIIPLAHPYLVNLTQLGEETSHLVMWEGEGTVQFIDKVACQASIRMASRVGLSSPAYLTATGKAILAARPQSFIDQYLRTEAFTARTPYTLTRPEQLAAELLQVRAQGYACDAEESELGLTCFAAPVAGSCGQVDMAVSVSGPTERMERKRDLLVSLVKKTAENISALIR